MFSFINRDHVVGAIFGVAALSALAFVTGCGEEKADETADTAVVATSTTVTETTTGTTTGTTGTTTGTTTPLAPRLAPAPELRPELAPPLVLERAPELALVADLRPTGRHRDNRCLIF